MLLNRYCFNDTLNLKNGKLTLNFALSTFRILALTVREVKFKYEY